MLTALFLVWLQMSAQPVTLSDGVNFSTASKCQEGLAIYITGKDGKSDEIAKCVNGYYERVPPRADEADGKPHRISYEPYGIEHPPEPVDVPAVQVDKQQAKLIDCRAYPKCKESGIGPVSYTYTCKDKSRILEHDENSPAKYWCRKVQP